MALHARKSQYCPVKVYEGNISETFPSSAHIFPHSFPGLLAAERAASKRPGLLPLRGPAGPRRPEEQQAQSAVHQPVEPEPQARTLRDASLCGLAFYKPSSSPRKLIASKFCSQPGIVKVDLNLTLQQLCTYIIMTFLPLLCFLQIRTLESIRHQALRPDMAHLSDTIQRLALQSRT